MDAHTHMQGLLFFSNAAESDHDVGPKSPSMPSVAILERLCCGMCWHGKNSFCCNIEDIYASVGCAMSTYATMPPPSDPWSQQEFSMAACYILFGLQVWHHHTDLPNTHICSPPFAFIWCIQLLNKHPTSSRSPLPLEDMASTSYRTGTMAAHPHYEVCRKPGSHRSCASKPGTGWVDCGTRQVHARSSSAFIMIMECDTWMCRTGELRG